jgi:hypothetical protein
MCSMRKTKGEMRTERGREMPPMYQEADRMHLHLKETVVPSLEGRTR